MFYVSSKKKLKISYLYVECSMYIQNNSKLELQTLMGDRAHHKDSELHRNQ